MRYLNKIVFINSAHIPYAEIKLDGNVHFIGTQGVGKSTLLRAILFFYNVDKSKLGIRTQDKQKSYDEFYFPYPNSYIIYEVCRENGHFFVMTFLSSGRVAFRIVDCPYEKHFFVEEDNSVRYEWGRISERIGTKVYRSNIIRSYEEFRDIIYGNVQNVSKDLRRFNLMESSRYQNVPRTIQNIFLNQSLESRVIKDTIISSMDFAGDSIDLNFYREYVKDFRQQYDDIWKWYKKDKNGKVKVKAEADKVIADYSLYEVVGKNIRELCAKLNYAMERDMGRLPLLEEDIAAQSRELARLKRLLSEEHDKYNKERDALKEEEGILKNFFKEVRARMQHYSDIGIDALIAKMAQEQELGIRRKSLLSQENVLTDKSQSVRMRYEALRQELDNSLKEFRLQAGQQINEIERVKTEDVAKAQSGYASKLSGLNTLYQQKQDDIQENIDGLTHDKTELRLKEQKIRQLNPYQKETEDLAERIRGLEAKSHALTVELNQKQREIERITNDTASRRKELENACEKDLLAISHAKEKLEQEIARLDELLAGQKGSFIEWLEDNAAGWKDNIGKVANDTLLYSTSLEPCKAGNSDTLYGIRIELQNVDRTVNTPEEIRSKIDEYKQQINALDNKAAERQQKLDGDIEELERQPSVKLKSLRKERINMEAELGQIPAHIGHCKKEMGVYQEKLKEWRDRELNDIRGQSGKIEEQLARQRTLKQQTGAQKRKEEEELRKSVERRKRDIDTFARQKKEDVNAALKRHEADIAVRRRELEAQEDAELKGHGVDVNRLAEIKVELKQVNDALDYIENHKQDYYAWQKDKKEYFDLEQSKKEERKRLQEKMSELQHKFDLRREKKEAEIRTVSGEVQSLQSEKARLEEAIDRVNQFLNNPTCPSDIAGAGTQETQEQLSSILDNLRDNISGLQQRMEEFKKAVTVFKSNFSPQNTFHFRTEFNTEADYVEFASELHEFISNNKIEEYRTRTSGLYADIIKRIAREVGDLDRHGAEIRATINEINRDFRENNFAGVIKEIELRAVESSDRLMQQLINIKKFDEEYGFDIGNLNLFSTEESQSKTNEQAVKLLVNLIEMMDLDRKRERITLSDTFKLEFKVMENDNDTNWVEKLSNVGSDGTDILVKSMVNIMLINVFKRKISKHFGDFRLHCMMDEIGKLHPDNVEGILKFANVRNIFLINSSPTTYNAQVYKYTYSLSKDDRNNTVVKTLLTIR